MKMGSSRTGFYNAGVELHKVEDAKVMKADKLAGLDEYERFDRVEIIEEDE